MLQENDRVTFPKGGIGRIQGSHIEVLYSNLHPSFSLIPIIDPKPLPTLSVSFESFLVLLNSQRILPSAQSTLNLIDLWYNLSNTERDIIIDTFWSHSPDPYHYKNELPIGAAYRYHKIFQALLSLRSQKDPPSQDLEAVFAQDLEDLWWSMSNSEQTEAEARYTKIQ